MLKSLRVPVERASGNSDPERFRDCRVGQRTRKILDLVANDIDATVVRSVELRARADKEYHEKDSEPVLL